ncbi:hypothetical protein MMC07_009166 [Pseudocyphellaria aurata]|nr:hypothetical protein [Pseudocyphellaria aurata]
MFTILTTLAFYYFSLFISIDYIAWLIESVLEPESTEKIPAKKQDDSTVTQGVDVVSINGLDYEPVVNDAKRRHARYVFTSAAHSSPVASLAANAERSIFPHSLTLDPLGLSAISPSDFNFGPFALFPGWKSSTVRKDDWGSSTSDTQTQLGSLSGQSSDTELSDSAPKHGVPKVNVTPISVRSATLSNASITSASSFTTSLPLKSLGKVENEIIQASGVDSIPEKNLPQIILPTDLSDESSLKALLLAKLSSKSVSELVDNTSSAVSPISDPKPASSAPKHKKPERLSRLPSLRSIRSILYFFSPTSRHQDKALLATLRTIQAGLASRAQTQHTLQATASMARYRLQNLRSHGPTCAHCVQAKDVADRALEEWEVETEKLRELEAEIIRMSIEE